MIERNQSVSNTSVLNDPVTEANLDSTPLSPASLPTEDLFGPWPEGHNDSSTVTTTSSEADISASDTSTSSEADILASVTTTSSEADITAFDTSTPSEADISASVTTNQSTTPNGQLPYKLPHMRMQQMNMRCPTLKIITWNVQTYDPVKMCSLAGISSKTPDLLLLQETNVSTATYQEVVDHLTRISPRHKFIGSAVTPRPPPPPGVKKPSLGVGLIYSDRVHVLRSSTTFPQHTTLNHRLLRADVAVKGTDVALTILNVYAPVEQSEDRQSEKFYAELYDYLERFPPEYDIMAGGDWNAIAVPKITKKTTLDTTRLSPQLIKFLDVAGLYDVYSHLVETGKTPQYTYTNRGRGARKNDFTSSRRLDCLHVSEPLLQFFKTTSRFKNHTGSSHHPVYFSFKFSSLSEPVLVGKGTWRIPNWVYFPDYEDRLRETIVNALKVRASIPAEMRLSEVLELVQASIQKDSKERSICLQAECRDNPERAEEITKEAIMARSPFDDNVPSHESFMAVKTRVQTVRKETNILELYGSDGVKTYNDTPTMCNIAQNFYKEIYKHKGPPEGEKDFLDAIPQSALKEMRCPELQKNLKAPFTEKELWEALQEAQHKSAPGMDGFTYKFYVTFWDQFKELLLQVFELAAKGTPVSRKRNTSVIRLIPKSGDEKDISNYRPISLINTELKLFTHLINRRMQATLEKIVHPNQTGFVPGRLMTTNLDTMDHYYNVYGKRHEWTVGMLDFKKAYDSISQEWIITVLEHLGFPERIINCVKSVQAKAASTINIRGVLSGPIPLQSGVRQGCPLSPTLFAIAIDPFIRKLDSDMSGLRHRLQPLPPRQEKHVLEEANDHTPGDKIQLLENGNGPEPAKRLRTIGLRDFQRFSPMGKRPSTPPVSRKRKAFDEAMVPLPQQQMKVSAFADDVALFMSGNDDVIKAGKVIYAFAKASKLCLNPSKTVVQLVTSDPDGPSQAHYLAKLDEALAEHWPTAHPKHPGEPPQVTKTQPCGKLFRYLGIYFGNKKDVDDHYDSFLVDLEKRLRSYALFGLKHHAKAWLLNMFFLSRLVFSLPYAERFSRDVVIRIRAACCDKINGRLCGENEGGRRTFRDELIYQPLKAGGIGLLNIVEQADSLRAARAARFFQQDTPARQNATFLFAAQAVRLDDFSDTNPALRLNKIRWFDMHKWSEFLSCSMLSCLRQLTCLSPVAKLAEPPIELDPSKHTPDRRLVDLFYKQRLDNPEAVMSQQQLDYLLSQIDVPVEVATASWREKFTVQKNAHWTAALHPGIDPQHQHWLAANQSLGKHYRKECNGAATLHMLRLSRLKFIRWHFKSDYFAYRDIGCGACQRYKEPNHLHEHLFVQCPAIKAFCAEIKVPLPERLADWVLVEKDGHLHYVRELAHAIWQLERALRKSGRDGLNPMVRRDYAHLFNRVGPAYLRDLEVMEERARAAAQRQV